MARVPTVEDVRQIIATAKPDSTVQAIITDAAAIVARCTESLDDETTALIVKYVAADMLASVIATSGKGIQTAKALGDASESYGGAGGAEFGKSAYWQRALMLDPNGCLNRLGKPRATFEKV